MHANYTIVDRDAHPDLMGHEDSAFAEVSPAKGARVTGTWRVAMSSHTVDEYRGDQRVKETYPSVYFDTAPSHVEPGTNRTVYVDGGASKPSHTVNGVEYGSQMIYVEFYLVTPWRDERGYTRVTVSGQDYHLLARSVMDAYTDAARKAVDETAVAIAAEFVTDERWLAYRIARAVDAHVSAVKERDDAQAKVDKAFAALQALRQGRA
ncbi:hypothetical protein JRC04_04955 [Mycolicibacterium sp. S2-37]|uniref:hypothetical protein n=1 Tax=Mycolicibacterium sp. S2-37 TaxID=2810297 RepID=UPI001A93B01A|nr:hypothetical protein [Mycolicibacterium sp. S2-37]MBO0676806.1 hypothetical protein [Mycolicibacterium sp. S2-37]